MKPAKAGRMAEAALDASPALPVEAEARPGPRPLALHLANAMGIWSGALAALPLALSDNLPWHPVARQDAAEVIPEFLSSTYVGSSPGEAVGLEIIARLQKMLAGIEAYRHHPYRRLLAEPPVIWQEGSTRLLDYGATAGAAGSAAGNQGRDAPPVLVVPSLVNRAYVLDLKPKRSLLRYLAARGYRPLLVDWGAPGEAERGFDLTAYIAGRLEAAHAQAVATACGPVPVVGYCMGGNLALALALRRAGEVSGLALLATPWDFHAAGDEDQGGAPLPPMALKTSSAVIEAAGEMPADLLQAFFAALDPNLASAKFRRFAHLDPASAAAENFVALEDWANDCVPLAAAVAMECLGGWYAENSPARLQWRVAGRVVDPGQLRMPTLVAFPRADRIVPPASARALARAAPGAEQLQAPSGHIGMIAGGGAEKGLWQPLEAWLSSLAALS